MDAETLKALTVPELQQELKKRGLKKSGVKVKLIQRLLEYHAKYGYAIDGAEQKEKEAIQEEAKARPKKVIVDPHPYMAEYEEDLINSVNDSIDANSSLEVSNHFASNSSLEVSNHLAADDSHNINDVNGNVNNVAETDNQKEISANSVTQQVQDDSLINNQSNQESKGEVNSTEGLVEENSTEDLIEDNSTEALDEKEDSTGVTVAEESKQVVDELEDSNEARDLAEQLTEPIHHEELEESGRRTVQLPSPDDLPNKEIVSEEASDTEKANNDTAQEKSNSTPAKRTPSIADVLHADIIDEALDYDEIEEEDQEPTEGEIMEVVHRETIKDDDDKNDNNIKDSLEDIVDIEMSEQTIEDIANEDVDEGEIKEDEEEGEIKKERQKPKPVVPVILKKNRVSLKGSSEDANERAARRKRRWASATIKEPSVTISGESIKKLLPDVKIDATALAEIDNEDLELSTLNTTQDGPSPSKRIGRTVKVDGAKTITLQQSKSVDETVAIESDKDDASQSQPTPKVSIHPVEEICERDKSPSPSRQPVSSFLHISNLVRPFTLPQLKRLISKTCEICENGFWINNIKSHCYIQVATIEQAETTRGTLHGLKWPSGTPKKLDVDFVTNGRIYQETDGAIGKKEKVVIEIEDKENEAILLEKEVEKTSIKKRLEPKSVEKNRDRRNSRSEKPIRQTKEKQKKEAREESPAKLLDDLFRKTKATPCIYWLPLTNEQILHKEKREEEGNSNRTDQHRETQRRDDRPLGGRRREPSPNRRPYNARNQGRGWR